MDTFSYHAHYSAHESTVVPHDFLSVITQTCWQSSTAWCLSRSGRMAHQRHSVDCEEIEKHWLQLQIKTALKKTCVQVCILLVLQRAMSQEMASQPSDDADSERSPRSDDEMEDDEDINHYYNSCDVEEHDSDRRKEDDPEYFEYQLLNVEDVERLLNESVEALSQSIKVRRLSDNWVVVGIPLTRLSWYLCWTAEHSVWAVNHNCQCFCLYCMIMAEHILIFLHYLHFIC